MKSATQSTDAVKLTLTVETGEQLRFEVYDPETSPTVQCVYAVLRTRLLDNPMRPNFGKEDNKFCIIYVGETNDLAQRIEQHQHEPWFADNGATHVCFFEEPDRQLRSVLRSGLVRFYAPDCNSTFDAQV